MGAVDRPFNRSAPVPAAAETYDGSRVVIVDGDTFAFGSELFRILNIDTPETFRPRCERELVLGLKAKERLAGLLRRGRVTIEREGQDRYRRALVRVYVGGRDVGERLRAKASPFPGETALPPAKSGLGPGAGNGTKPSCPRLGCMPRYYFDTDDGETEIRDEEGLDLPGLEVVRAEAAAVLPHMAKDALPDGDRRQFVVTVREVTGSLILRATLSLVVEQL